MTKRAHGWIARALAPALTLATAAGLATAIGGCIDEEERGDDGAGEVGAVYFITPDIYECWVPDQDGDGFDGSQCGGDDCDDLNSEVYPGNGCTDDGQTAGCTSKTCCTPANPACPGEEAP